MTIRNIGNDLPAEHAVSHRQPNSRPAISTHHELQKGRNFTFYPSPPLRGRTFSFYTQADASNSRILGVDLKRRGLAIQNLSAQSVFMSVGSQPGFESIGNTFNDAIEIPVNGYYEFPANCAPTNDVYVVSLTAGAKLAIFESILALAD